MTPMYRIPFSSFSNTDFPHLRIPVRILILPLFILLIS